MCIAIANIDIHIIEETISNLYLIISNSIATAIRAAINELIKVFFMF